MKFLKLISFCLIGITAVYLTFQASKDKIKEINSEYTPRNPLITVQEKPDEQIDIDKMISHTVVGAGHLALPIKEDKNYTIHQGTLYITSNEGEAWIPVPDDTAIGYARISDYLSSISEKNIYSSTQKMAVVYGGRGSDNISIMSTDGQSSYWSVASISQTATHNLQKGYDELFIDYVDVHTGYLLAIRNTETSEESVNAYRSVNGGTTWDPINEIDSLYKEITAYFGR